MLLRLNKNEKFVKKKGASYAYLIYMYIKKLLGRPRRVYY